MAIRKMKKLSLVALKRDTDRLVKELTYLRAVQLTPLEMPSDRLPTLLPAPEGDGVAGEMKLLMQKALALTARYRKKTPGAKYIGRAEFERAERDHAEAISAARRAVMIDGELADIAREISEHRRRIMTLSPWRELAISPASPSTAATATVTGTVPPNCDTQALFADADGPDAVIGVVSEDSSRRYVTATYLKKDEKEISAALSAYGFARVELDRTVTLVAAAIDETEAALAAAEKKTEALGEELRGISAKSDEFELLYDFYSLGVTADEARRELFYTQGAVLLQGWVPEHRVGDLEKTLEEFECFYELGEPRDDEEPPVMLKNNPVAAPFEFILSLYAYPKYRAFDPTGLVAFFFFFTFGFMMQDIAYGLIILIGCLLFIKIKKPRGQFRQTLKMFALCGVSTIFAGVLFGGFFGDLPQSFAQNMLGYQGEVDISLWFSPLSKPMDMFIFSLAVGVIQVLCGICVSAYMKIKRREFYNAVADDISWLLLFIGGGAWYLLPGAASTVGLVIALTGAALVILLKARGVKNPIVRIGKGLIGIYGVVNYASDILSYSRIMALALSGAVIANVMNLLGTLGGPTPVGIIVFVLLLVLGTVLNLLISVLGAFVHTARLQYIEFFGKFYEEGGVAFAPLQPEEKYYVIEGK